MQVQGAAAASSSQTGVAESEAAEPQSERLGSESNVCFANGRQPCVPGLSRLSLCSRVSGLLGAGHRRQAAPGDQPPAGDEGETDRAAGPLGKGSACETTADVTNLQDLREEHYSTDRVAKCLRDAEPCYI